MVALSPEVMFDTSLIRRDELEAERIQTLYTAEEAYYILDRAMIAANDSEDVNDHVHADVVHVETYYVWTYQGTSVNHDILCVKVKLSGQDQELLWTVIIFETTDHKGRIKEKLTLMVDTTARDCVIEDGKYLVTDDSDAEFWLWKGKVWRSIGRMMVMC